LEKQLIEAGSSMEKVLKVSVFLNDIKDYKAMNDTYMGRFKGIPPVRTTVSPAGGVPGNSLVEIDCIAYI
jgi:enamine deaminase RidA (YjgF/YER057c/UK114 family)